MNDLKSSCCACGKSFKKYSNNSLSISRYGGVVKDSILPKYTFVDMCPKCSKKLIKIDWAKTKKDNS